jgi:hypothetical protein
VCFSSVPFHGCVGWETVAALPAFHRSPGVTVAFGASVLFGCYGLLCFGSVVDHRIVTFPHSLQMYISMSPGPGPKVKQVLAITAFVVWPDLQ